MSALPVLRVDGLSVDYGPRRAVDQVSLEVDRGRALAIVGESGCGKSSLARAVLGLERASEGHVLLDGTPLSPKRRRDEQRRVQMVFQDISSALNPRRTVRRTLAELLLVHRLVPRSEVALRCEQLMELVGLPSRVLDVRPGSLSGGQRQRVGIARALAVEPDVLVADEAVSALDVSVQATILALLADLRDRLGLALLFITHDLGVVRNLCDEVAVMYAGRIVETGPTETVFTASRHPYAHALLDAAPRLSAPRPPGSRSLAGEPPSGVVPIAGCAFAGRCPAVEDRCRTTRPEATGVAPGARDPHRVACHVRPLLPTLEPTA